MQVKTLLLATGMTLALAGAAFAQSRDAADDLDRAPRVLEVSPEETVLMQRYLRDEAEAPPVIEEHMTLRPGSVIPEGVPLRVFSRSTELARFAYFVSVDDKVVIADPRTRTVVRILDRKG